jgi:hypothetical protein
MRDAVPPYGRCDLAKLPPATSGSAVTSASIVSRHGIPKLWRRGNFFMTDPRASSGVCGNGSALTGRRSGTLRYRNGQKSVWSSIMIMSAPRPVSTPPIDVARR